MRAVAVLQNRECIFKRKQFINVQVFATCALCALCYSNIISPLYCTGIFSQRKCTSTIQYASFYSQKFQFAKILFLFSAENNKRSRVYFAELHIYFQPANNLIYVHYGTIKRVRFRKPKDDICQMKFHKLSIPPPPSPLDQPPSG